MRTSAGTRTRRALFGVVFIVALLQPVDVERNAWAEELHPNRTYAGGTRVEASSVGISFAIPPGWVGRFGQEAGPQAVVLGSDAVEGVGVIVLQVGQTVAQVAANLSEPQNVGSGVVLRPTSPPAIQGSRLAARYENETSVGRALALLGPMQNSVTFFFIGPQKNEAAYVQLLIGLAASTNFLAPAAAQSAPANGLGQEWRQLLAGQMLHYFSRYNSGGGGGGMAAHRVLHLCSDGSFGYSGQSLVTMNVPGASGSSGGRGGSRGRWSLETPTQTTAVLVLSVDGGPELRWPVRYDGKKTFVNGQRWLRAPSDACR